MLSLLITAILICGCNPSGNSTPARIDSVQKQIHVGMTKSDVERILNASGLEYSWSAQNQAFMAIERDVTKRNFASESRQLIIRMGTNALVSKVDMKRAFTGP
jgi:hypothetical protein